MLLALRLPSGLALPKSFDKLTVSCLWWSGREQSGAMDRLSIATVIVTWNRCADLIKAIDSLKQQTYPLSQIIVVDNGSADNTVDEVQRLHPDVLMIPLGDNTGACYGRNMGTREVKCDLAFYIDDDITLDPDCIGEMVGVFRDHPEIGAVQATVIDPWSNPDPPRDQTLRHCPHPREGAFAFRMNLMPRDPWPEHFNRQGEGPWMTLSLYERGYPPVWWPPARVYHHCSPGGQREKVLFFFTRNSLLTFYQRMPLLLMPPLVVYKTLRPLLNARSWLDMQNWIRAVGDGMRLILSGKAKREPVSWRAARAYFHAVKHNLRAL